MKSMLGANT